METNLKNLYAFLKGLGADKIKHSRNNTLLDHLWATYLLLKRRNKPEYVALAGAFHSVYGTVFFKHVLTIDRELIRSLIGEQAERLVYEFSITDRTATSLARLSEQERRDMADIIATNAEENRRDIARTNGFQLQMPWAKVQSSNLEQDLGFLNEHIRVQMLEGKAIEQRSYHNDESVVNHASRNCLRVEPPECHNVTSLMDKLALDYSMENFKPHEDIRFYCTNSELIHYPTGGHILSHYDEGIRRNTIIAPHRSITCMLYLNDNYEGGEIEFPDLSVKPKACQVLIFPGNQNFHHKVNPVTSGFRNAFQRQYGFKNIKTNSYYWQNRPSE